MALIRLFLDISLFTKGPQNAPESMWLLLLAVLANLAAGIAISAMDVEWGEAIAQAAIGIVLMGSFLWLALFLGGKLPRFLKTSTAAFGCDTLIGVIAIPLLILAQLAPEAGHIASILLSFLMLWQIAVIGHILRHALSVPLIAGLVLALAYTLVSIGTIVTLFPSGP